MTPGNIGDISEISDGPQIKVKLKVYDQQELPTRIKTANVFDEDKKADGLDLSIDKSQESLYSDDKLPKA